MAEKYYWLKLQRDFFKRHDVQIVESMKNGKDYVLFYLKLLCESIDHEGRLRFSESIPYNDEMLATITNTNIDTVRSAVKIFTDLGLMELLDDGTFYMSEVQKMVGSASNNPNAIRQQRYRDSHRAQPILLDSDESVTESNAPVTLCVTKSKSKNKSKNKSENNNHTRTHEEALPEVRTKGIIPVSTDYSCSKAEAFMARFNMIDGVKKCLKMTGYREMLIDNLLAEFSEDDVNAVFQKIRESDCLTGRASYSGSGFQIFFDWLLDKRNFLKVLEGVYDVNKQLKPAETIKGTNIGMSMTADGTSEEYPEQEVIFE